MTYNLPQAVRDALAVNAHIEQLAQALGATFDDGRMQPGVYNQCLSLLTVAAMRDIALAIEDRT